MHATLSDVIADTAQNAIEAGADRIVLTLTEEPETIRVTVVDNGKGMDEATCARAFDPFYSEAGKHDRRRVGLGLPILKQLCEATDGHVALTSRKGEGTTLAYSFRAGHIDVPPMGDLAGTILALFNYPGSFEFVFTHAKGGGAYTVSRAELADATGGLESAEGLALARLFLASQESSLEADAAP